MSFMTNLPFNRPLATFVLLTFCVSAGCSNVRAVGVGPLSPDEAESLVGKKVRLHTDDGVRTETVETVDYPYIVWTHKKRSRSYGPSHPPDETVQMRIDLREIHKVEIVEESWGNTALLLGAIAFVILMNEALGDMNAP